MDFASLIGPAVAAAIISSVVAIIGIRTTRSIHAERLAADQALAERKLSADIALAEKKLALDQSLTNWKRRYELAEQALIAFYEARDVFVWVRSRGLFGGEGQTRVRVEGETDKQAEERNTYFVPIERLTREKALFARLQTLRYAFAAHFGDELVKPFGNIDEARIKINSAASILIQMASEFRDRAPHESLVPLRNDLGWGPAPRPDAIDQKITEAVAAIEAVCKPVLREKFGP
jgi:hypothetical protein